MDSKKKYDNVDEYIQAQDENSWVYLNKIREIIRKTAPKSKELISYGMPAYKQNGILVYFAANKNHLGFYPTAAPIEKFKKELTEFKTSKGAIQFPYKKGIPEELVRRIMEYRLIEDDAKAMMKKKIKR